MMRFCPECDNMLLPQKGKLFCKTCQKEYEFDDFASEEYTSIIRVDNDELNEMPVYIVREVSNSTISSDQRKAFEDYFVS